MKIKDSFAINTVWQPYSFIMDEEQRILQEENLIHTGLKNGKKNNKEITFLYTKTMKRYLDYLDSVSKEIRLEDTAVSLEDEVFYTSKIEGAKTTRVRTSEIHNGFPIRKENEFSERMVKNGFCAVKLLNLYGNKLNEDILLRVWNTLIQGVCENESIRGAKYRTGTVYAGENEMPSVDLVPSLMEDFIGFYNSPIMDELPFLKASLLHYLFETIHPFPDGNGRMGRLLINNYLLSRNVSSAKAVSFSMQIDRSRGKYDVAFFDSNNEYNDCTPFLEYMLSIMCDAYENAKNKMIHKVQSPHQKPKKSKLQ